MKAAASAVAFVLLAAAGAAAWRHYRPLWAPAALRDVATAQNLDADAVERAAGEMIAKGAIYALVRKEPETWLIRVRERGDVVGIPKAMLEGRGLRLKEQLGSGLVFDRDGATETWTVRMLTSHYAVLTSG